MKKAFIAIVLIVVAAVIYFFFQTQLVSLIQSNLFTAEIYYQIVNQTLLGLFYVSVFGALFFVPFPAEVTFAYYVLLGHNPLLAILVAVVGNLIGLSFNYSVGRMIGPKLLQKLLKDKYLTWSNWVSKRGNMLLFFGNAIPFPIEPASLVIGGFKYPFVNYVKWSALGRVLKYVLVYLLFIYAGHTMIPLINTYLNVNLTTL